MLELNKTVGQPFILPFISEPSTRRLSTNGSQGSWARLGLGAKDGKGRGSTSFSGTQNREGCGSGPKGAQGAWSPRLTRVRPQNTEPQCLWVLRPYTSLVERILLSNI